MSSKAMIARGYAMHGKAQHVEEHGRAHSILTQNMASHSDAEHNTAPHVMAWRQVLWRVMGSSLGGLGRSGVVAPYL
eukprot:7474667-Pyramimonas_sp.AAC.1